MTEVQLALLLEVADAVNVTLPDGWKRWLMDDLIKCVEAEAKEAP